VPEELNVMSIQFNGIADELSSPFLEANAVVARQWNIFAESSGTEAAGTYNAYQIEVNISLADSTGTWSISGHRRQSTVGGGIPMNSPVHELTYFKYDPLVRPSIEFRIQPSGIRSSLLKLLGKPIHPSGISTDLVVITPDMAAFRQVILGHERQLAQLGLRHLIIDAATGLEAKLNVLLKDASSLTTCLNTLSRLAIPCGQEFPGKSIRSPSRP
jgi:hypothetical protein